MEKRRWVPFTADQFFTVTPPGFDWDARVRMLPGLNVFVRDAFREGAGLLHAQVAGLATVADATPSPDLSKSELLRWLAEAAWFPSALLPSQGVRWQAVGDDRALATVEHRGVRASLEFRFGPDGLPVSVFAYDRPRLVGAVNVPTPRPRSPERFLSLRRSARDAPPVGHRSRDLAALGSPPLADAPLPPQVPPGDRLEHLAAADEVADRLVDFLDRRANGVRDLPLAPQKVARHHALEERQDARAEVRLPHGGGL